MKKEYVAWMRIRSLAVAVVFLMIVPLNIFAQETGEMTDAAETDVAEEEMMQEETPGVEQTVMPSEGEQEADEMESEAEEDSAAAAPTPEDKPMFQDPVAAIPTFILFFGILAFLIYVIVTRIQAKKIPVSPNNYLKKKKKSELE